MLSISVRHNIETVKKTLNDVAKRQLPFAIAKALTATAKDVQGSLVTVLPRQLDRPTPFTLRAFAVTPATKQVHRAKVFIRPEQWKYLKYQIEGGVRKPARRALILPKNVKLNQFGNMPRRALKQLLAKKAVFSGTVDGVPGIYLRKQFGFGTGVQLLARYADRVAYRRRFPYETIGTRAASKAFDKNFRASLELALSTLR